MQPEILPELLKFMDETCADPQRQKQLRIHYIGGEPLLNFEFMKASVPVFVQHFGPRVTFSINTNLLVLTDEILEMFVKYNFNITTSIDGGRETHNAHRGNWDTVVANLAKVKAAFIDAKGPGADVRAIGAVFVVSADRADHVLEDYRTLSRFCNCHINLNAEDPDWTDEKVDKVCDTIRYIANTDPRFFQGDLIDGFKSRYWSAKDGTGSPFFCHTPMTNVTINPMGKLFFCHRLTPKSYQFTPEFTEFYGDLREGYVNTDYYNRMVECRVGGSNMFEDCKTCKYVSMCRQNCRAVHITNGGKVNKIICKYAQTYFDLLEQYYGRVLNEKPVRGDLNANMWT
jgi:radical SAM protein with 4Fe4S-binding SPASM domain